MWKWNDRLRREEQTGQGLTAGLRQKGKWIPALTATSIPLLHTGRGGSPSLPVRHLDIYKVDRIQQSGRELCEGPARGGGGGSHCSLILPCSATSIHSLSLLDLDRLFKLGFLCIPELVIQLDSLLFQLTWQWQLLRPLNVFRLVRDLSSTGSLPHSRHGSLQGWSDRPPHSSSL